MEHKSIQSDTDTENAENKLANEKLLEKKEKLETELDRRVSEFSRLNDEKNKQKNENIQVKQMTNALQEEEEKLQIKLKTQGNMLVHLKDKVSKREIENTKNKSGGNGGIGFPESSTVSKFVEPTLDEKLRNT